MLQPYSSTKIQSCLSEQRLIFFGGSKARQIFWTVAEKLDPSDSQISSKSINAKIEATTRFNSAGTEIIHVWDPTFNSTRHALVGRRPTEEDYAPADYPWMIGDVHFFFQEDGIHLTDEAALLHADIVLNYFCNKLIGTPSKGSQAYCCASYVGPNVAQKLLLFMSSCAIVYHLFSFFGSRKHTDSHDRDWLFFHEAPRTMGAVTTISVAVLYCFIADRTVLFDKASKTVEVGKFIGGTILTLLAGLATFKQNRPHHATTGEIALPEHRQLLSRQQTEEWKGWMQIIILLYHYFGLSKVLWVYQFVRLLVSSYLFMTGFGHTYYFITTNDFSFHRVASVLLRTNVLNIILAFVMGTRYDLYYFPMLTSLWFLIVWATVPKTATPGVDIRRFVRRTAISVSLVRFTLGVGSSDSIAAVLATICPPGWGLPEIDGQEFLFRFSLDAYIAFIGMITAVLYVQYDTSHGLQCHKTAMETVPWSQLASRLTTWGAAFVILAYSILCGFFADKFRYNGWHPFLSPFPVLAFVVLRNSTRKLSASHSRLFAWFGRCSLETFVFQYHTLLAADSRGVLRPRLACKFLGRKAYRGMFDALETAMVVAAFLCMSAVTTNALSTITKSLVGLGGRILLPLIGLWILNLSWNSLAVDTTY
ncbi:hypothetical protein Z517_05915 [Fonsecaea pedrosoi CBS 271.37]|uniref:Cas1p 10 TM acyl transferase domain-containing protein n=1 Tax=Fonsecaea pedrosoi CBS 271.37 TaxID=1442368 RepID=A0A0D2GES6_9EURO|nr:uncharacterized protein Z517_05915 [Fonsecaea pedrosoi CBS 271.37]KIW79303.1 hypothetical protein Z517_05915 [Fonsecaea pedrosoi CBS 271.37]